jgi:hypothetical protein
MLRCGKMTASLSNRDTFGRYNIIVELTGGEDLSPARRPGLVKSIERGCVGETLRYWNRGEGAVMCL